MLRSFLPVKDPKLKEIRCGYEKAGLSVSGEPIPWNAEAVIVEAVIGIFSDVVYHKSDFQLRLPDRPPRMAVLLHPEEQKGVVRVVFRLPPLQCATMAAIHFRGSLLGRVTLPFLTAEEFLRGLRLESPTVFVLLGGSSVACGTFIEGQARGLTAGAVLTGPTSLVPLIDFPLRIEFTNQATGAMQQVMLPLNRSQLLDRRTYVSASPPEWSPRLGACSVRWILGDRLLATAEVRAISAATFQQSLYLVEGRYVAGRSDGAAVLRHSPGRDGADGFRPCFLIASCEPDVAALCRLEVRVQFRDPARRPVLLYPELLVLDGPTLCVPDLTPAGEFQQVRHLELGIEGRLLGILSVSPTPVAAFNSEGGFRAADDFEWTPFVEEELVDRLAQLMEIAPGQEDAALASLVQG
jgi:hypothetical protein